MQPTSTEPSETALWARALTLVQNAGPAFARNTQRSGVKAPIACAAMGQGKLGSKSPQKAIVQALRAHPELLSEDDGSNAWRAALIQFMVAVRDLLEAAGPAVLIGLHDQPVGRGGKTTLDVAAKRLEKAFQARDARATKLYRKIRDTPEQAIQSVQTHLGQDTVKWHNALTLLAFDAPSPRAAALMGLLADVLRKEKVNDVFSGDDLVRIARLSPGTFLQGQHQDLIRLRLSAVGRLGDLLDDPESRDRVATALQGVSKIALPAAGEVSAMAEAAREALAPRLAQWAAALGEQVSVPALSQVLLERFQAQDFSVLTDQDWAAAGRWAYSSSKKPPRELANAALDELLVRWEFRVEQTCDFDTLGKEEDPAAPKPTARFKMA